ncbi:MAG: hypothetical protein ACMUIM_04345 [bacterium]
MTTIRNPKSVFILFMCLSSFLLMGIGRINAQYYLPNSGNPFYGNLSWNQGGLVSSPFLTSGYPFYQTGSYMGSSGLFSDIRVMPSNFYSGSSQSSQSQMVEGELLIYFSEEVQVDTGGSKPTTNIQGINELIDQYGVYDIKASYSGEFYTVKFSKSHGVEEVSEAFEDLAGYVERAKPNLIRRAHTTTSYSGLNTNLNMWSPQVSGLTGLTNFSNLATGLTFGTQSFPGQSLYSNFSPPQSTFSTGSIYAPLWQNQSFPGNSLSLSGWQQSGWGLQQNLYNLFPNYWY